MVDFRLSILLKKKEIRAYVIYYLVPIVGGLQHLLTKKPLGDAPSVGLPRILNTFQLTAVISASGIIYEPICDATLMAVTQSVLYKT